MLVVGAYRDVDARLDIELSAIVGRKETMATMVALHVFSEREMHDLAAAGTAEHRDWCCAVDGA